MKQGLALSLKVLLKYSSLVPEPKSTGLAVLVLQRFSTQHVFDLINTIQIKKGGLFFCCQ